jgi:hypothetical protein
MAATIASQLAACFQFCDCMASSFLKQVEVG